jgi:hypothetical protein
MNLDELLKSIRDEGKKESTLSSNSSTVNTEDEKLVEEVIDPKVLEILGIDFTGDLTYGEYKTILKEKMAAQRMGGKVDSSSAEAVTEEFKRVKRKDSKQRFKVKNKKIKAEDIKGKTSKTGPSGIKVRPTKGLLPGTGQKALPGGEDDEEGGKKNKKSRSKGDPLLKEVIVIKKTTKQIADILKKQGELFAKQGEKSRISAEKGRKKSREGVLESSSGGGGKIVGAITKPFTSIFDAIKKFLLFTLLGSLLAGLLEIFKNPKKLLQPIQDVFDSIVGFLNKIINFIDDKLIEPFRFIITQIQNGLNFFIDRMNDILGLIPGAPKLDKIELPQIPNIPELESPDIVGDKENKEVEQPKEPNIQIETKTSDGADSKDGSDGKDGADAPPAQIPPQTQQNPASVNNTPSGPEPQKETPPDTGSNVEVDAMRGGGIVNELMAMQSGGKVGTSAQRQEVKKDKNLQRQLIEIEEKGRVVDVSSDLANKGGKVKKDTGVKITGLGPDTQLTALQPGEVVVTEKGAKAIGVENLLKVNESLGGSNKAKKAKLGDVSLSSMSDGGVVDKKKHPLLEKMSDGNIKKASAPLGRCVTGSLDTMLRSGVPEPAATGNDVGNNPRGAISQLMQSPFNWKSMGGSPINLNSPYGNVRAGVYTKGQYGSLVKDGKIPSGALVFQSRYNDWNGTAPNSSGYDMAIAQRGGKGHWNGQLMPQFVYGGNTKKIIVLTPDGKKGDGTDSQIQPGPAGSEQPSPAGYTPSTGSDANSGSTQPQSTSSKPAKPFSYKDVIHEDLRAGGTFGSGFSKKQSAKIAKSPNKNIPEAPAKKTPQVLPLPGIGGGKKQNKMNGGTHTGGGTPPVTFSSTNPAEMGHRSAIKSLLGIVG